MARQQTRFSILKVRHVLDFLPRRLPFPSLQEVWNLQHRTQSLLQECTAEKLRKSLLKSKII